MELSELPDIHNDPFDRALVAAARVENIPLLSKDSLLKKYGIQVIW